ncbi:flavin-binding monooxygenase, putative [Talaromyces stipitatus ATCC 10500]|uniref:Flavin-binding monooxygenase, putative n=1 Tax=Talaromyces stipitatus (strain ATCC 10500 / CBS 375.48 / QM 6759 / NRRL 1006) TaxID=441959 RepID=B8LUF3_TALSN|nr:flavin-binding monooxygenase, putative [Talaromyces stipitatus ATCC 10500]EED23726.1 flavin-binding monooxygenase, putative [Talaromyces stipitatus ATCC 10500]
MASIRTHSTYDRHGYTYYPVAIIGAGESGIAMGCQLKQQLNFDQFRIFERRSGIGGTWWSNRYPGVACDIPAILYSFSFAQNPKWTSMFPSGREIAAYLADVCAKYEIVDKLQFHTEVTEMRWLEDEEEWEICITHLAPGTGDWSEAERRDKAATEVPQSVYLATEKIRAKIVISAVGGLVEPQEIPKNVPGFDIFEGELTHTARWDEDIDVKGKDVVVVGTGASAAQVVVSLSSSDYGAKSVTQLLRTAPWIKPDDDGKQLTDETLQQLSWYFQYIPGFQRAYRSLVFFLLEHEFFLIFSNTNYSRKYRKGEEEKYRRFLKKTAPAKYLDMLTPDYDLGCKRRIIGSDWLRSLHRPNVNLTSRRLKSVNAHSVTLGAPTYPRNAQNKHDADEGEVQLPADILILANGYRTNEYLHPISMIGRGGRSIHDVWKERGGPQAYLGIAMDKFPNFFMLFGPNTTTGHTSVILGSENAISYTMRLVTPILKGTVSTWEIKEKAELEWANKVQDELKKTPFNNGSCTSWYTNDRGWNSTSYPFSQIDYGLRCMFPVWKHWESKLTTEGLKQRRRKALRRSIALVLAVTIYFWGRRNPSGVQTVKMTITQVFSKVLVSAGRLLHSIAS